MTKRIPVAVCDVRRMLNNNEPYDFFIDLRNPSCGEWSACWIDVYKDGESPLGVLYRDPDGYGMLIMTTQRNTPYAMACGEAVYAVERRARNQ